MNIYCHCTNVSSIIGFRHLKTINETNRQSHAYPAPQDHLSQILRLLKQNYQQKQIDNRMHGLAILRYELLE